MAAASMLGAGRDWSGRSGLLDRRGQQGPSAFAMGGGVGQSFMHMINALSLEEAEDSDAEALASEDAESSSASSDEDDVGPSQPDPRLQSPSSKPSLHSRQSTTSIATSDDDDDEAGFPSASVSASGASGGEEDDDDDEEDADPPSFLSPLPKLGKNVAESAKAFVEEPEGESGDERAKEDLASSLYAIHRPIAARRRKMTGEGGEVGEEGVYVEQEREGAPKGKGQEVVESIVRKVAGKEKDGKEARRAKLADKLADVFALEEEEEVVAEYQCWLFRSVLLQGFMYLTKGHICFYAYLPKKEGTVLRSERLLARGAKTRRYYRHWFILKDDVLSWYPSSSEPYFPDGHIDLHYCISVEASQSHKCHFKVSTAEKKWHFSADSEISRDEWVKLLKKVVFSCQNEGQSVKIAIPLETVIDIERSSNLEFAETIRVRVYDADEGYSIDEYWLSYFADLEGALEEMTRVLREFRALHPALPMPEEGAESRPLALAHVESSLKRSKSASARAKEEKDKAKHQSSWSALSSRLRLFSSSDKASQSVVTLTDKNFDQAALETPRRDESRSPARAALDLPDTDDTDPGLHSASSASPPLEEQDPQEHTYPPEPSSSGPPAEFTRDPATTSWAVPSMSSIASTSLSVVPEWLKGPPRKLLHVAASPVLPVTKQIGRRISEVVSKSSVAAEEGKRQGQVLTEEAKLEKSQMDMDEDDEKGEAEVTEKFRKNFGLTEKESVVAVFHAYLFRGIPNYGKVYISTSFFCFRSVGIQNSLLPKTQMILPLEDILGMSKHRSFRIGYSGLIVVIKGHEELFLELQSSERRDACIDHLERQVEFVRSELKLGKPPGDTLEHQDHLDLLNLGASRQSDSDGDSKPLPESAAGQPPVMFCSTSSDFVTFRPEKSLRFTCLTIGSRGDVQPYIALCKGLMAEGHTCKIASHGEYRSWVEGHGIAFEEVGGDPAELMQLMIAHDFFTIAFMKEAVSRFRGWLDDLLETTWVACQDTDVLIESPSAIAGYHIAEALRIPYYRAFTMPWSRTRAYPHAFAVPDHKLGGGYNFMSYTMFDHIFWRATSGQINRWRKKTLGLRSTSLEAMQQHKIPFLYNFSPVVVPPALDWRENIHVTGYWWLDNPDDSKAQKWQPPADLLEFLAAAEAAGKKIVFIGFGSIIIPDPEQMTRVVTEAVEAAGVFAVVAKGWSDRAISKDATAEDLALLQEQEAKEAEMMARPYIYNVKSIPHDWLFPRIHAAVHHGGAGTTGASLRAGLPTIIKPFFGDQHFYADRVATLGIGSAVRNLTVETLASAISTAVTDEKQIARAHLAGEMIRKEDGVGKAIECIYRDLEYARSLIPPPPVIKSRNELTGTPQPDTPSRSSFSRFARPILTPLVNATAPVTRRFASEAPSAKAAEDSAEDEWDVLSGGSGADTTWEMEGSRSSSVAGAGLGGSIEGEFEKAKVSPKAL
ncbi:hypothetical protein MNV49_001476 [Pseudohyphozyma bogoriensis]|nr:hypothetical protein MNV49_001476 [Pseudohyphozyma bogoriensis]